ncbi:hypothetical protein DV515_00014922 [Chloebia gouldiae]|uniref:Uncharacterized protein n=1 Tax=Chloebia gouldiae TaxID=44316 RepID=A0A3L8RWX0_CHLGU|nr:hypothetical protein DV515_00014922 [Chloebia gouldiae]
MGGAGPRSPGMWVPGKDEQDSRLQGWMGRTPDPLGPDWGGQDPRPRSARSVGMWVLNGRWAGPQPQPRTPGPSWPPERRGEENRRREERRGPPPEGTPLRRPRFAPGPRLGRGAGAAFSPSSQPEAEGLF